ncbi:hypothetical protein ACFLIM_29330 [Nonomuraea sp. M3C6]|uniref:Uncharacterized protein n=1 Tax=Nonomuraea marmarensis TaxID=3351344 RepID=A0ABW7AJU2_9ACTN
MRGGVLGDLVKGQVCLFAGLSVCLVIMPGCLSFNCGMSDFGVHWGTAVPYAFGFLGAALFTRRGLRAAAPLLPAPRFVRVAGDSFALLLVGILLTPYTLADAVHWVHRSFGAALFLYEMVLAVRLLAWGFGGLLSVVVQVVGGVTSGVSVVLAEGPLVVGQAVFQLAFGVTIIRMARLLPRQGPEPGETSTGQSFSVN